MAYIDSQYNRLLSKTPHQFISSKIAEPSSNPPTFPERSSLYEPSVLSSTRFVSWPMPVNQVNKKPDEWHAMVLLQQEAAS